MVKITYTGNKFTRRKLPSGQWLTWRAGQSIEIESKKLVAELTGNRDFVVEKNSAPKVGGGVKTHVKSSKSRGRPAKSKPKKEVAKPKKGLKKAKKGKAD